MRAPAGARLPSCILRQGVSVKTILMFLCLALPASAQEAPHSPDAGQSTSRQDMPAMNHTMAGMNMDEHSVSELPSPHEGSGTSWQPASVRGHEWMWMRGGWELMAHGAIFIDYNHQSGPRGEGKAESVNWGMLMEQHRLGKGTILLREMFS